MDKWDKYWIGIVLGLLLPLAFIALYLQRYHLWTSMSVLGWGMLYPIMSKLLQVSVFPNLALVFVFYTTDTWRLSKGVLIGALPYLIAAIAMQFS